VRYLLTIWADIITSSRINRKGDPKLTAIRRPGKVNENTTLIDFGILGVAGIGAVYLVGSKETLLIDCGTRAEAPRVVRALRQLNSFPPDNIVFTHSHDDHCQGIHYIRKEAEKEGKSINVMASHDAIPLLEDQSWLKVFDPEEHYENIKDVNPIKEGEVIDLKGLTLKILSTPGHSKDHIAILDEKNKNLFVGDLLGLKLGDNAFVPPFMPPYWDTEAFYSSIKKLRGIHYESICLAHFGLIYDAEAKNLLNEAVTTFEAWWKIYESAEKLGRLDEPSYLAETIKKELQVKIPEFTLLKPSLKFLLSLMNLGRKLIRKEPYSVGEIMLRNYVVKWLAEGYKTYKNI